MDIILVGAMDKGIVVSLAPNDSYFGIRFKPSILSFLLDQKMNKYSNKIVSLKDVSIEFYNKFNSFREKDILNIEKLNILFEEKIYHLLRMIIDIVTKLILTKSIKNSLIFRQKMKICRFYTIQENKNIIYFHKTLKGIKMKANNLSSCIITDKIDESREFYTKNFNAKIIFDCGWYLNMEFGDTKSTLQFMSPQQPDQLTSDGSGLIYNFEVDDVDLEYEKLIKLKNQAIMPLDNHPWGDRGFAISDPNGITLYIYSIREPSQEFKQYFK